MNVKPLHISKNFNLEGIKLIGAKHIEDAVDLVDYLPLTMNGANQIIFTMRYMQYITTDHRRFVHSANKSSLNYSSVTKKSQYRK